MTSGGTKNSKKPFLANSNSISIPAQQTLGNHDFDDGIDNLVSFLSHLNFSVVVSNLNVTQEPKWPLSPPLFVKSTVLNVGGTKIGLVGYVLKETPS